MEIPNLKPYIQRYNEEAGDYEDFDSIASDFKNKAFLTKTELLRIAEWKLKNVYYPIHKKEIESNSDKSIEETTKRAINEINDKKKVEILDNLYGVGIPVASAILTVLNPKDYAIIDVNVWYALHFKEKRSFTSENFRQYLEIVRGIALKQNLTAREVDKGLFILGKDRGELKMFVRFSNGILCLPNRIIKLRQILV